MVDNAPSVGIVRCPKNPVDAREKNIQQRAKFLSLAGALRKGKQLQLDKQNRFDFCERALANLSSSLLPISVFKGTMMNAVNYQ